MRSGIGLVLPFITRLFLWKWVIEGLFVRKMEDEIRHTVGLALVTGLFLRQWLIKGPF